LSFMVICRHLLYMKENKPSFAKLGKKERTSIIFILIAAFLFGLLGSVVYKSFGTFSQLPARKKLSEQAATPVPARPASLALQTASNNIKAGETFTVDIYQQSPDGVEAADFVVNFDPEFLAVDSLNEGNYFKNYPINKTEETFVKLSGVATLENNTVIVPKGKGIVGTIVFKAVKNTDSTSVSFDRTQTIVAYGGKNILDQSKITDLEISIN